MKKIIIAVLGLIILIVVGGLAFYNLNLKAVSSNSEEVEFEVTGGYYETIPKLKKAGLIKNELCFKIYVKLHKINKLQKGKYVLNKNMSVKDIVNEFNKGNNYNPDQISITFKEGLNIRKIATLVSENTNNSYDDFMALMVDKEYIKTLISKYWFLTDDILNEKIYYPLEGYLFPETYFFKNKDVTSKEIVETMLDQMGKKLEPYKKDIEESGYSIHQLMTLASIVEMEGASSNDRAAVAGVFVNRINDGWSLGSDVTTYYYLKIDDFKVSLNGNPNLYTCDNAYNTRCRSYIGLPVGPISNPGTDSLVSTIKYEKHDYYYFVADCKGKTYLSKNSTEHYNTIQRLKSENNWCV